MKKTRKSLIAVLAFLLSVLLVLIWIGLARRSYPGSPTLAPPPPLLQIEPPRRDSSMVYDPLQHSVLLFGGTLLTAAGTQTNETWSWNGQSWHQLHPSVSPPALQGSMVYDAASRQTILFLTQVQDGGSIANEMWNWNGSTWQQIQPPVVPEVLGASIAYDAARGQVLLFGGETPGAGGTNMFSNATWTWNGLTWQEQQPATAPSPRTGATLAYDEADQQIVLYGGITATGLSSDTWTWNGLTWQQIQHISSPPARQSPLLVYDGAAQQMLLFGGINAAGTGSAQDDTWVLKNNGWVRISVAGAPADLYASVTYDDATRTVLVYATQGSINKGVQPATSAPISQTWIWNGTTWKLLH